MKKAYLLVLEHLRGMLQDHHTSRGYGVLSDNISWGPHLCTLPWTCTPCQYLPERNSHPPLEQWFMHLLPRSHFQVTWSAGSPLQAHRTACVCIPQKLLPEGLDFSKATIRGCLRTVSLEDSQDLSLLKNRDLSRINQAAQTNTKIQETTKSYGKIQWQNSSPT